MIGKAQRECVSDDALKHFRTYKYSSVDKSTISQHVLRHYVRPPCKSTMYKSGSILTKVHLVEFLRRVPPIMAGTKHGDSSWILLHHL